MTSQQLHALRRLAAVGGSMPADVFAQEYSVGTSQLLDALLLGGYVAPDVAAHVLVTQAGLDRAGVTLAEPEPPATA